MPHDPITEHFHLNGTEVTKQAYDAAMQEALKAIAERPANEKH
jgi:hypothetical protein